MLLTVEGGFISSSASGYPKGLAFLLFGRRDVDERTLMRVLPTTLPHNHPNHQHYQLFPVKIDSSPTVAPLAQPSKGGRSKTRRGYARFLLCFSRSSPDADATLLPLEGEPVNASSGVSPSGCKIREVAAHGVDDPVDFVPKSSLKKSLPGKEVSEKDEGKQRVVLGAVSSKRKVQWTDVQGRELAEIREFERSEVGKSGGKRGDNFRMCSCIIR